MLFKTKGIVLRYISYGESSIIVKIYTEAFGLKSYIVKGVKSRKAKFKANLFQPLTLLDLIVYNKTKSHIQNIKDARISHTFKTINADINKASVLLFISEILNKSIREEEKNEHLFDFIYNSVILLDNTSDNVSHFHLVFMMLLTKHLGFFPQNNFSDKNKYFNLREGIFTENELIAANYISPADSGYFSKLISTSFEDLKTLKFEKLKKKKLLENIIRFYELHLESFKNIKSAGVLQSVFE
ncbi:MAG: DNA repair protein RecO [Bacteroidales bacterium]|nr:DNA repair protein RecO [Bacteroidales bacterium]